MPERNLPFFAMFSKYRPGEALAARLEGWLVTGAVMDSHSRTIEASLLCPALPDPALLDQVAQGLAQVYGLNRVTFLPACPPPAGGEEAAPPPPGDEDVPPPAEEDLPPVEDLPPEPVPASAPAAEAAAPAGEEGLSPQEKLFRQTEALRQQAMK